MAAGPVFPAFLRLEHQADGSAKASFLAEVASITQSAESHFTKAFAEIGNVVKRTASSFGQTKLRFDVDSSGFRQAAADAELTKQKLIVMREASRSLIVDTRLLSAEFGDVTEATKRFDQALSAQVIEATKSASEAQAQARAYEMLTERTNSVARSQRDLADALRATFMEQAKAENFAYRSQQAVNAGFAPGLNRQPKSARDSASVFEEQSYAPKADMRSAFDRFREGAASLDKAAVSGATLESVLGRVAVKGDEVRRALEQAGRAATEANTEAARQAQIAAQEADRAAAAQAMQAKQYAAAAAALRGELDPMYAAQQRFDQELARADQLFEAGAISAREYAAAQQLARNNLNAAAVAITQTGQAMERTAKQGTTAQQNVINSTRASRVAFVQLGQQMQDVTVQAQMGTNAFTIFAQQVPQAAFALSGLEGSANKTQDRIGRFATFLSGPWGAAIFAATAVLGPFIANLLKSEDASDKAKKALDYHRMSANELQKALADLDDQMAKTRQNSYMEAAAAIEAANARMKEAIATREAVKARQELILSTPNTGPGGMLEVSRLEGRIADQDALIAELRRNITENSIVVASDNAKAKTDPEFAINLRFDQMTAGFKALAAAGGLSAKALEDSLAKTNAARKSELDVLRESQKVIDSAAKARKLTADTVGSMLADRFPGTITSTTGGKHTKGSYHYSNQAVDFVPAGGMGSISKDDIRAWAKSQGINLLELLGPGDKNHSDHFHIAFSKTQKSAEAIAAAMDRASEKAEDTGQRLAEYSRDASDRIANISQSFGETPTAMGRASSAMRQLADIADDIQKKMQDGLDPSIAAALAAQLRETASVVQDSINKPFRELVQDQQRSLNIQSLALAGREEEAQALQQIYRLVDQVGEVTEDQRRAILANVEAEKQMNDLLEARQEIISAYTDTLRGVRGDLEALLGGQMSGGSFLKSLKNQFQAMQGRLLTEQLFGPMLRQLDDYVRQNTGIKTGVDIMKEGTEKAGDAATDFATATENAAARIDRLFQSGGLGGSIASNSSYSDFLADFDKTFGGAANDNGSSGGSYYDPSTGEIVVNANKGIVAGDQATQQAEEFKRAMSGTVLMQGPDAFTAMLAKGLVGPLSDALGGLFGQGFGKAMGGVMGGAMEGYLKGGPAGGILGALKGIPGISEKLSETLGKGMKGAQTGTMVAGLGKALGLKMSTTGSQIGGAIGAMVPIPGGEIIGSVIGGLLGGMFKKTKWGRVMLSSGGVSAVEGNSGKHETAASEYGNSIFEGLQNIVDAFGGTMGDFGNIAVGVRHGDYRVNLGGTSLKKDNGAVDFNDDAEAAIKYAIMAAIERGAIQGIRESTQRLLKAGDDLDKALQKALDFEGVFKRLKAYEDPVGAALDTLDAEFRRLKDIFDEAGASAAEYADLEKLYGIERAKAIEEATQQITGSLRDLYEQLTIGDSGLSLRDRRASALAAYNPLAERVRAGDVTAYDDYAEAARSLLEIEREMYGSQSPYFDRLKEMTDLTKATLDQQQALADASTNRDSPFSGTTTVPSNDNATVVSALDTLGTNLLDGLGFKLDAVNANLGLLLQQRAAGGTAAPFSFPLVGNW